jgi:hypothetical protein
LPLWPQEAIAQQPQALRCFLASRALKRKPLACPDARMPLQQCPPTRTPPPQALFSKMLYLTEHEPLVAQDSEAFKTTDLRMVRAAAAGAGAVLAARGRGGAAAGLETRARVAGDLVGGEGRHQWQRPKAGQCRGWPGG